MSNTGSITNQKGSSGHAAIFLYRAPKKNHDALVRINKHSHDFFMKHGISKFEVFNLNARENIMDFVNVSRTVSANDDEDVWLEIQSYRDAKHVEEFMKSMEGDKSGDEMYKEFMELISPSSIVTFGDFSKLEEIS